jgi:hypothetical protein
MASGSKLKKKPKKRPVSCKTLTKRAKKAKRHGRKVTLPKRCRPKKKATPKTPPKTPAVPLVPVAPGLPPVPPAPIVVTPPAPGPVTTPPVIPTPPPGSTLNSPIATYGGTFGRRQAERLLWRAGFGPAPGQAEALAALGLEQAILSLTRPTGDPVYAGPAPQHDDGDPLDPVSRVGDDHLWWFDLMVRTNQPLTERMALIWHDWFATSFDGVNSQTRMLEQNQLFREAGLGSFHDLARAVTQNPAMLIWLDGRVNWKTKVNENYGREFVELFTLGADRGAYTETDVRELARAFTGFQQWYDPGLGQHIFRYNPNEHDAGSKTIFGQTGEWDWRDACRMALEHPLHSSFFVNKLWAYFMPLPPSESDRIALEKLYRDSDYAITPVVEAILAHPALYDGPRLVKSPVVYCAGLLRAVGQGVTTDSWYYVADRAGQRLFMPPNVAGWDETRWLDTKTLAGRWSGPQCVLIPILLGAGDWTPAATIAAEVDRAVAFWGDPPVSEATLAVLRDFATTCIPNTVPSGQLPLYYAQRQNALRQLVGISPDLQCA